MLISGTVSRPGEEKFFRFHAEKDQKIVAEVFARRQNSPLDSLLKVRGPDGKQIAVNDDFERPNIGLNMQHVDSYICFKAPAKGVYTVILTDTAGAGGKDYGFFLRLDRPRPDFRVYMVPSGVWLSPDSAADPVKVVVEKLDGFNGEISFELRNSKTTSLAGIRSIPAGASESQISFSTLWTRSFAPVYPELWAVHGKTRRRVMGADSAMQAFAYTHYIPSRQLIFMPTWVHGNGDRFQLDPKCNHKILLKPGEKCSVNVFYRPHAVHTSPQVEFSMNDAPKGVTLSTAKLKNNTYQLTFTADKKAPKCNANMPVKVKYTFKYYDRRAKTYRQSVNTFHLPMFRVTVR